MTSQTLRLPGPRIAARPRPGLVRRASDRTVGGGGSGSEGTSLLRLIGTAMIGWVGLMLAVTLLAVF
ncbi:MAG TPA: hypothetical protein VGS98_08150 [Thermoanaerobaculia bacterium]|jgi:hypothetical protein|nr:hypothetical protein [Thermoanaerobaculia bacterium]